MKDELPKNINEFSLLGVIADIRHKTGVGDKIMLGELANALARKQQEAVELVSELTAIAEWAGDRARGDAAISIYKTIKKAKTWMENER